MAGVINGRAIDGRSVASPRRVLWGVYGAATGVANAAVAAPGDGAHDTRGKQAMGWHGQRPRFRAGRWPCGTGALAVFMATDMAIGLKTAR